MPIFYSIEPRLIMSALRWRSFCSVSCAVLCVPSVALLPSPKKGGRWRRKEEGANKLLPQRRLESSARRWMERGAGLMAVTLNIFGPMKLP